MISIVHCCFASTFSFVALIWGCKDGSNLLFSDYCLMNPNLYQLYYFLFTIAYLIYDFFLILIKHSDDSTPIMKQTLAHHVVGAVGCLSGIYADSFAIVLAS
jgi:hypothetical protein